MSTTLGMRHEQKVLAIGLRDAVLTCLLSYDKEHSNGDDRAIPPGAVNAILLGIVGETVGTMLGTERLFGYGKKLPNWRQRLMFRYRTLNVGFYVCRQLFAAIFDCAARIGREIEDNGPFRQYTEKARAEAKDSASTVH